MLESLPNEHHYTISMSFTSTRYSMGLRDWFKKKPEKVEEEPPEIIALPELDKETLLEETQSIFDSDDETLSEVEVVEATPEYDVGDVELDDLLDNEMASNYELNTVEDAEYEDLLKGAQIVGDVSSEVSFETE